MMKLNEFDKTMAAVAFAEADEAGTAREILGAGGGASKGSPAEAQKKKPYGAALLFGAISISCYIGLFMNERLVTSTFTKGGINTLFPVLTAFFFSFIHGAFASNLLSVFGLEAKKK